MKFAIYDLETRIPSNWTITLDRRSVYTGGAAAIMTPNKNNMQLYWDRLEKYTGKNPSVESYIGDYFERMKNTKSVKTFETSKGILRSEDEHEILPHEFNYVNKPALGRSTSKRVMGALMYDKHSNRFAILYSSWDATKENPDESAIKEAIRTFECRCNKTTP
jgi:hypothetical protein